MDTHELRQHVDSRLDRIETKLDAALASQSTHAAQLVYLQGFARIVITILISGAGFFAVAYLTSGHPG